MTILLDTKLGNRQITLPNGATISLENVHAQSLQGGFYCYRWSFVCDETNVSQPFCPSCKGAICNAQEIICTFLAIITGGKPSELSNNVLQIKPEAYLLKN